MRRRSARSSVWGVLVSASVVVGFAMAPVQAAPPPQANPSWGDITSVMPGPGLTGGATEGDATLGILFGGNGTANSVAHSDHNHDAVYDLRYAPLNHEHAPGDHNHDGVYAPLEHLHNDVYALVDHNHDGRYLGVDANFDDRYSQLGHDHAGVYAPGDHNHDGVYAPLEHLHNDVYALLGHDHDADYLPIDANFDDRYLGIDANFDDRYSQLGHDHDGLYLGLGGGTLNGLLTLAVGDLTLLGSGAKVVAPQLVSTVANGTAPLEVTSGTLVTNLNADKLDGHDASDFVLAGSGGGPDLSGYAQLAANNAFTGVNTFNGATTFGSGLNQVSGGANFTWQPFYSSATNYSLRLTDTGKAATRLIVNQDGRVGIGTTSPGFALHVIGDVRASNLSLGTGILSPFAYDMASSSDRTFSFTNSNGGVANLSVEGNVSAAGYSIATGGSAARAGSDAIASGATTRTVATTAAGSSSLVFVTADATGAGCVPVPGPLYVSTRSAGASFTVAVVGAAPGAGESYCFSWWVVN